MPFEQNPKPFPYAAELRADTPLPALWFKVLPPGQGKPTGECYDVMFCEVPGYTAMYPGPVATPDRQAFEEWAAKNPKRFPIAPLKDGVYPDLRTQCAWEGWQR